MLDLTKDTIPVQEHDFQDIKIARVGTTTIEIEWEDEDGNIHKAIRPISNTFDPIRKAQFLEEYEANANMGKVCKKIGVSVGMVKNHINKDPEFAEAVLEAEETYKGKLLDHHQDLLFNGTKKYTYDKEGQIKTEETKYPIRLIELELKKHDEGYRDRRQTDVKISGGVLVAPAETSVEDWSKKFGKTINQEEVKENVVESQDNTIIDVNSVDDNAGENKVATSENVGNSGSKETKPQEKE